MPRAVTVTFADGSSHIYQGVPDDATPEQVEQRAANDFAGKRVQGLDGGRAAAASAFHDANGLEKLSAAAAAGFGRGGRAPSPETLAAMRDNGLTRTVQAAINDPIGTAQAIPSGFNRGVAQLAGVPVDTIQNTLDLGKAAIGPLVSRRVPGEEIKTRGVRMFDVDERGSLVPSRTADRVEIPNALQIPDRSRIVGSGDYLAAKLDRGSAAVGGAPVTQNPRPNNPAARILYAGASGVPGAITGRAALAGAGGGTASQVVAEAGGGPGAQALAGITGGRAIESVPTPRQQPRAETPRSDNFGRDTAGAAAAMPELARVPQELRPALAQRFRRGDRDLVARVVDAETLPIPIPMLEGQATGNAALISRDQNMRGTDTRIAERMQQQNTALVDNLDEIRRQVAPNVVGNDHVQNGQQLIDIYKAVDAPVRAEISAAYKALEDAAGGSLPLRGDKFVDAAMEGLQAKMKTRYLPAEIRGDLDAIAEKGGLLTFEQYENLRTTLATAARDADRGVLGGGGNAASAIRIVRDALENMPMDTPVNGARVDPRQLKALADRARSLAKARFERVRQDPAYEAAVDDPTPAGELSPFADDFVRKFVINGKTANIQRMQANLRAEPLARELVAAAAMNYVKGKSGVNLYTNEGNFSQAGYNRALSEIMPRINVLMPRQVGELAQQLGRVAQYLQVQPRGSFVNNSNTWTAAAGDIAKKYIEGGANTIIPGANLGTFIRDRRAAARARAAADRALDPRRYLTADGETE